jgi:propanediol utilization protein
MNTKHAAYYGVRSGELMKLRIESAGCSLVMEELIVRADETSKLEVHIDTDEGNACHLDAATKAELLAPGPCQCQTH